MSPAPRVAVRKTYKLFIGGAFPRSESGRSYPICGSGGQVLANAALASRKDLREAVVAARKAQPGWAKATAYLRGQVVYRVAEMLEGRHAQFVDALVAGEELDAGAASSTVDAAVDRLVWYAGWSDKFAQVAGSSNPVAGPYFNFSVPEPTGVVGVLAPQGSSLLGLVSVIAPVITTGTAVVVVAGAHAGYVGCQLLKVRSPENWNYTIDFGALELRSGGNTIHLTLMESELLRHLVRNDGRVVSRKQILEEVWGLHEDTDTRAIDNFVVRLRRYIEDDPATPRHLLTVRGVGYRFLARPEKE